MYLRSKESTSKKLFRGEAFRDQHHQAQYDPQCGKMLEKMEEKPDRLVFNDLNQLVLYYGTIEVRLGDDENMDEKINRLVGILPELEGMSGILHMENTTEDSESVVFDDATRRKIRRILRKAEVHRLSRKIPDRKIQTKISWTTATVRIPQIPEAWKNSRE